VPVAFRFFRSAVAFAVLGLSLGLYMALSHDHAQIPTHVHLLMIGWVSMFLFGAFYALVPAAAGRAALVQWWLANTGVAVMIPGLWLIFAGTPQIGGPVATLGALVVFAAMLTFAGIVWWMTMARHGAATSRPAGPGATIR
jgi:hypothetical protein